MNTESKENEFIDMIKNGLIHQRRVCKSNAIDILYDDQYSYINQDHFMNNYKIIREHNLLEKVNGFGIKDTQDEWVKFYKDTKMHHRDFIIALAINALNQFCFWFDPSFQEGRILKSSDIGLRNIVNMNLDFLDKSVTLRKERVQLNHNFRSYIFEVIDDCEYLSEIVYKILEFDGFNYDIFKKKKELFLMLIFRYFDLTGLPKEFKELKPYVNPAIDYQVPKMLQYFDITRYPIRLIKKINNGKLIQKDSNDELFIRSLSYFTLLDIQDKLEPITHNGIITSFDQIDLDWFLWSNRDLAKNYNHHCTLTEDY